MQKSQKMIYLVFPTDERIDSNEPRFRRGRNLSEKITQMCISSSIDEMVMTAIRERERCVSVDMNQKIEVNQTFQV